MDSYSLSINRFLEIQKKEGIYENFEDAIKVKVTNAKKLQTVEIPSNIYFEHNYLVEIAFVIAYVKKSAENIYYIFIHFWADELQIIPILLDTTRYPRIYNNCSLMKTCEHASIVQKKYKNRHVDLCLKHPKYMHNCKGLDIWDSIEGIEKEAFEKMSTVAMRNKFVVDELIKLSVFLNTPQYKYKKRSIKPRNDTPTKNKKIKNSNLINAAPFVYLSQPEHTGITRTSAPKCKHYRRGHYRRIGDRLVKVKGCLINKDGKDKTYKI
jgi:hypothetical protein